MDVDYVFACEYCGELVDTNRATVHYRSQRDLADGRVIVTMGTYCGPYCGNQHAAAAISYSGTA